MLKFAVWRKQYFTFLHFSLTNPSYSDYYSGIAAIFFSISFFLSFIHGRQWCCCRWWVATSARAYHVLQGCNESCTKVVYVHSSGICALRFCCCFLWPLLCSLTLSEITSKTESGMMPKCQYCFECLWTVPARGFRNLSRWVESPSNNKKLKRKDC